ncbi:MAG TPA: [FeFe] hydrogenase H-cluster radical SAM maturase HydE [Candidatus Blautia gallistercoris]|uniref:[FeFe] hydrogenase H-cluster radical SAM maturase HydE n=1 Tax=Candidatus Blautia gallistercoris TaxID=2838490 RepID=A0A9D2B4J6_9FIRM|nr:[FeFe] hydrogenase H-cluster radical SAM maturase HydE [Candidatus Blautia gallistercoris]
MNRWTEKLRQEQVLTREEFAALLDARDEALLQELQEQAVQVRQQHFGNQVYIRGLIEFTNYCRNDCYYCGIRRSNRQAQRYRLTREEILECCRTGYELGFRTFVLQGGEDGAFSAEKMAKLVSAVKEAYPDCAVTLSVGEYPREVYRLWKEAGADRYLLRHETADESHYRKLHPASMSGARRKECLWNLKDLGYQVGTGFMVGSPFQTTEHLVEDLLFIHELQPQMVGIGPYVTHKDTPFAGQPSGSVFLTLYLLAILRLMLPKVLLPATTALGTMAEEGREQGILSGANVVMPNLSPVSVRKKYMLYDNKIATGSEAAEGLTDLQARMERIGYQVVVSRGDALY